MKRDWDVIREVLIEVEGLSDEQRLNTEYGTEEHPDDNAIKKGKMAWLLYEAGFLSGTPVTYLHLLSDGLKAPDLTWSGYDLLDTLRSKPVWDRIKAVAKDKGIELTFDAVKALGAAALKWVVDQAG